MEDIAGLIARLTSKAIHDRAAEWDGDAILCEQAADALAALARENAFQDEGWANMHAQQRQRAERAEAECAELRGLLMRIRDWDMFGSVADGPYWRRAIDAALAAKEKG